VKDVQTQRIRLVRRRRLRLRIIRQLRVVHLIEVCTKNRMPVHRGDHAILLNLVTSSQHNKRGSKKKTKKTY